MPKMSTEDFLKVISQLESSGGKNLNHSPAIKGVSAGDTAIGQYGLMPQTAYEVVHPTGGKVQTDPSMWQYNGLSKDELSAEVAKNPDLEKSIATQYAQKVLNRAQNPGAASQMWLQGVSQPVSSYDLPNIQRVQKFQQLRNALNPTRMPASIDSDDEDQE